MQNTQQHRGETQQRQFALALQEKATLKETQVQDTHKSESAEINKKIQKKAEDRKKRKRKQKQPRGESAMRTSEQEGFSDDEHHIDFEID